MGRHQIEPGTFRLDRRPDGWIAVTVPGRGRCVRLTRVYRFRWQARLVLAYRRAVDRLAGR